MSTNASDFPLIPPSVASVTSVRCISQFCGSRPAVAVSTNASGFPLIPPSVASVTSVRCFPNLWFSPCSRGVHQRQRLPSYSALCGLRDLCAMLSQFCGSRPAVAVSTNPAASPFPLCGLRDLCAMLSQFVVLALQSGVHQRQRLPSIPPLWPP